jgi:hypothetical protein
MTEGCDSCVSIQTCTECKCGGQTTAPVDPSLWTHDANTSAENSDGTPADAEANRVAPAAVSPPPNPMKSYEQMINEPQTDLEGLDGDDKDLKPDFWMGGIGALLIASSFLIKHDGAKDVSRGLGIVIAGMAAYHAVGTWSR